MRKIQACSLALLMVTGAAGIAGAAPPSEAAGWSHLPRLQLDGEFAGPLQDTLIQRWRDSTTGAVCYLYLPITAAHSGPLPSGYVDYGANSIGSISCIVPPAEKPRPLPRRPTTSGSKAN